LPLYFLPDKDDYLNSVYHEETLAQQGGFIELLDRLPQSEIILSPAVANFIDKGPGETTLLGRQTDGDNMVDANIAGAVWYLPGSPVVSVTDRESFDAARVDYVNYLFANNAYIIADPNKSLFRDLDVLITGIQFAIDLLPGSDQEIVRADILSSLPVEPANIRTYDEEVSKTGSDMYIFLARQNVQIYLLGGLLLAIIGILSVAYTNYLEDRRTLGLLRIRGAGPKSMLRFFGAGILAPSFIGLVFGAAVSLIVGYGITNLVWQFREIKNVLIYLATHIAISELTIVIFITLLLVIAVTGLIFSQWVFRKTVREGLSDN
ncbi:MAG: ABC transporter permease, partial [Gammaproteobacteria bacterium]|nr:ABC transporter permease [Gammaproteobacteria bacterium]